MWSFLLHVDVFYFYFWYQLLNKWTPLPLLEPPYYNSEIPVDEYEQDHVRSADLISTTSVCRSPEGTLVLVKRRRCRLEERAAIRLVLLRWTVRCITCAPRMSWMWIALAEYEKALRTTFEEEASNHLLAYGKKPILYECTHTRVVLQMIPPDDTVLDRLELFRREVSEGIIHHNIGPHTYVVQNGDVWVQEFNDMTILGENRDDALVMVARPHEWLTPMETPAGQAYLKHLVQRWAQVDKRIRLGDLYYLHTIEPVPPWMYALFSGLAATQPTLEK